MKKQREHEKTTKNMKKQQQNIKKQKKHQKTSKNERNETKNKPIE